MHPVAFIFGLIQFVLKQQKKKETRMNIRQLAKSKTLDFNVFVGAAYTILQAFGVDVPEDVLLAFALIGNFALRFFTKKPLAEK